MTSYEPSLPTTSGMASDTGMCKHVSTRPIRKPGHLREDQSDPAPPGFSNSFKAVEDHFQSADCHAPGTPSRDRSIQRRPTCTRCSRPQRVCICFALPSARIPTRTHVIIVQTVAEAKAKVRTADLVPLVLQNATIITARKDFEAKIPPNAILLFPGHGSKPLELQRSNARTLVFIDATWDKAQRLLNRSQSLRALARASLSDQVLGKALFRARKPPTSIPSARSTAEAVAGALNCIDVEANRDAVVALRKCVYEASESQLRFVRAKGKRAGKHRRERAGYEEGWYDKS